MLILVRVQVIKGDFFICHFPKSLYDLSKTFIANLLSRFKRVKLSQDTFEVFMVYLFGEGVSRYTTLVKDALQIQSHFWSSSVNRLNHIIDIAYLKSYIQENCYMYNTSLVYIMILLYTETISKLGFTKIQTSFKRGVPLWLI